MDKENQINKQKSQNLEPNKNAISYNCESLKIWSERGLISKELEEIGLDHLEDIINFNQDVDGFIKSNPTEEEFSAWIEANFQPKSREYWLKTLSFFDFITANKDSLKKALAIRKNSKTFALPSHPLMFSLLALFAGKPEKIPRFLLEKPHYERTDLEKKEAEEYLSKIFETSSEVDYSDGYEKKCQKKTALICNNSQVEGKADIAWNLFHKDISFREERLAAYIKRTFGPEGIRHLLGLIIGLEENFRTGSFQWSVNDHLNRLGYRKKANRTYDIELRKMASQIVKIFTGLCITSIRKNGKKGSIQTSFLFVVEGFEVETFEKEVIDEIITLGATDCWYKNAFSSKDGQAPKYTKLLREIVKENHREHPLTLYLAPLLAIFWRMEPEKKIKVVNLMEWCDLNTGRYKLKDIRYLESSLEYMLTKKYLGSWSHNGKNASLVENEDPLNLCLTLNPPEWLKSEIEIIEDRRKSLVTATNKNLPKTITPEEFNKIFEESGLTVDQFGQRIGVTKQYISLLRQGKRKISKNISERLVTFQEKGIEIYDGFVNKCDPS